MTVYILGILFSLAFLFAVIDLMRRRLLLEQYSLFWLGMGVVVLLLSIFHAALNSIAHWLGVVYAPSLLFLVGLLFMLGTTLQLTVTLSRLNHRSVRLVQELAMLRAELERGRFAPPAGSPGVAGPHQGGQSDDNASVERTGADPESLPGQGL